jgi:DMSO/TMAO reductase YedYZ molybdopterin-dependent catalytic subunit
VTLPPGQRRIDGFPRFGTHLHHPPPRVPEAPAIEITGAVTEPVSVPLERLARLPRTERTADFHCVAGWSATGLRWEGVAFASFYRELVEPALRPGVDVTHLRFRGLDGYA